MQLQDLAGIRKVPRQQQCHLREMSGRQQPDEIRHVRGRLDLRLNVVKIPTITLKG